MLGWCSLLKSGLEGCRDWGGTEGSSPLVRAAAGAGGSLEWRPGIAVLLVRASVGAQVGQGCCGLAGSGCRADGLSLHSSPSSSSLPPLFLLLVFPFFLP